MIRTGITLLVLLAIAATPAAASSLPAMIPETDVFAEQDWLISFVQSIERQIDQTFRWMWSLVNSTDTLRERIAPILDRVYAAQTLSWRIQAIINGLPSQLQWTFGNLVSRLRALPAARPGTAEDVLSRAVKADPNGPLAQQAQALDDLLESNAKALAEARAASATAADLAKKTAEDAKPIAFAQEQVQAAQEIFERAQTTPSTRAAMQLLIEAFAAQMDQYARWNIHALGREAALVQSQALLAQQLFTVVDRLATAIDLQNARQKQELLSQVHGTYAILSGTASTYTDMADVMLGINSAAREQRRRAFLDGLRRR